MSTRTKTLATSDLSDPNGFITALASADSEQSYDDEDFDGVSGVSGPAHGFAYYPTATLGSSASSYVAGSKVTWTGSYAGKAQTSVGTVVGTDGNETVVGANPLEGLPTSIVIQAQADANGSIEFGWKDALPASRSVPGAFASDEMQAPIRQWAKLVSTGTGNLHVGYRDGSEDTVPTTAGYVLDSDVRRFFADSTAGATIHIL